jgi:hypothetical protein
VVLRALLAPPLAKHAPRGLKQLSPVCRSVMSVVLERTTTMAIRNASSVLLVSMPLHRGRLCALHAPLVSSASKELVGALPVKLAPGPSLAAGGVLRVLLVSIRQLESNLVMHVLLVATLLLGASHVLIVCQVCTTRTLVIRSVPAAPMGGMPRILLLLVALNVLRGCILLPLDLQSVPSATAVHTVISLE